MVVIHIIKISPPLMSSLESSDFPFLERETAAGVYYERITGRPLKATTRPTGREPPAISFLSSPWSGSRIPCQTMERKERMARWAGFFGFLSFGFLLWV